MYLGSNKRPSDPVRKRRHGQQRGLALVMVLIAISTSLILTLGFLRTQTSVLQLTQNARHHDLALQAARTGASSALHHIQTHAWAGVDEPLQRTLTQDSDGVTRFTVEFLRLAEGQYMNTRYHRSLYLVLRSTGSWQSRATDQIVHKTVEILVELQPRLTADSNPDPPLTSGLDIADQSGDFGSIRHMALFAEGGRTSLSLGPGHRIEGDVWIRNSLRLFQGPTWSKRVRSEVLRSIGAQLTVADQQSVHPHPLSGQLTHFSRLSSSTRAALDLLNVTSVHTRSRLIRPRVDVSTQWSYCVYEGGPTYEAVPLSSSIKNVNLAPTPDNPLGMFYRNGNLTIQDNVTIRGSLFVSRKLLVEGNDIHLCSFDWRGVDGEPLVEEVDAWPRLPAIVANNILMQSNVRLVIEGAVICDGSVKIRAGDLDFREAADVDIQGLATSRPVEQPYSVVTLQSPTGLNAVEPGSLHAIWLGDDSGGNWFPIVQVDDNLNQLIIRGQVKHATATSFRIRPSRLRFVDIRGPVTGQFHTIRHPPNWTLIRTLWYERRQRWLIENQGNRFFNQPQVDFIDWLADFTNFTSWHAPYNQAGLDLESTVHLRATPQIAHHSQAPLFRPFPGVDQTDQRAGYRWNVVSWRELP